MDPVTDFNCFNSWIVLFSRKESFDKYLKIIAITGHGKFWKNEENNSCPRVRKLLKNNENNWCPRAPGTGNFRKITKICTIPAGRVLVIGRWFPNIDDYEVGGPPGGGLSGYLEMRPRSGRNLEIRDLRPRSGRKFGNGPRSGPKFGNTGRILL